MDKTEQGFGRYTAEDLKIIREHFNNDRVLKVVRKVMLPELTSESLNDLPMGGLVDIYGGIDLHQVDSQIVTDVKARRLLLSHLNFQLSQLEQLAKGTEETPEQRAERERKNSTK